MRIVGPDRDAAEVMGANLMDPEPAALVLRGGLAPGARRAAGTHRRGGLASSSMATTGSRTDALRALEERHGAHNYHPLPVVLERGEGAWVWDVEGRRYFDALAAYSALNLGHRHPALVAAAEGQLARLTLTSRAFHSDQLGPFCAELAAFCGKERVLPMNTGAEAVETAIKLARKWGHERRGIDEPHIVVCSGNFHGRTTTIVSFSDDPLARDGFGPYTPGFVTVPYGDAGALAAALEDPRVVAFLVEPIQGEAGVVIPPDGYLAAAREACTGRGRPPDRRRGPVRPRPRGDALRVRPRAGRPGPVRPRQGARRRHRAAVGGGGRRGRLRRPASGRARLDLRRQPAGVRRGPRGPAPARRRLADRGLRGARRRGRRPPARRRPDRPPARPLAGRRGARRQRAAACERLLEQGVLCKDTHETTLRVAPPLVVDAADLDWALDRIERVLAV